MSHLTPPAQGTAAVLFDLDGTFADTAPDMGRALNRLREAEGHPPLPMASIRPQVSHGARGLLWLGFGLEPGDRDYERLRQDFLGLYQDDLARGTRLFPGMGELLDQLEGLGLPWGIVTNKPGWLTDPLLRTLGWYERAACVVSGDTTPHPKPHPEPLWHACRLLGVAPARTWYVGDAERDIAAGRAAGTRTLVALFGYLGETDRPERWGADGLLDHPGDILYWVGT